MSVRSFQRAHARRQAREQRRASTLRRKSSLIAGLALSSTALFAANAQAAQTLTVMTNGDDAAGGSCTAGSCTTLRDAISQAATDGSGDTITFDPSVVSPILLSHGALAIVDGLTITGPGASTLAVSGNDVSQVFNVDVATNNTPVSITGLTITHGNSGGSVGGAIGTSGSRVPDLTLTNDTISDSTTSASGGGGGVYSTGNLTLTGSTVTGNTATGSGSSGGGVAAPRTKYTVTNPGTVKISNSTISGNTAAGAGGGTSGGAVLLITDSHVTDNRTTGTYEDGGGIFARGGFVDISGTTVTGNTATGYGGGILFEPKYGGNITNSVISGNTGNAGGGIGMAGVSLSLKYSPMNIADTTVANNHAQYGAGIADYYVFNHTAIKRTTISGNTGGATSQGGGLALAGPVYGNFDLSDSTISGNSASLGAGAIIGYPNATLPTIGTKYGNPGVIGFDNSTIAGNTASAHAGGIYLSQYKHGSSPPFTYGSATVGLTSTIVAGNTAAGISDDLERGGSSTSGGFNGAFSLVQSPGNAPFVSKNAVITGVNPQLGPLADNGGPTQTMLPSGTSPVIDQGHAPTTTTTDQRGLQRTVDTAITNPVGGDGTDIGAVELPASSVVLPPPPPPPPPTPTSGITLSIHGASLSLSSRPLLVGNQTPVTCSVKAGTLNSCVIEVRGGGKLLGSGEVTSTSAAKSLTTTVTPTRAGLSYLKHRQLGVDATATLVASQSAAGSPVVTGNVHFLHGPSITLGLGKRSDSLSNNVVTELNRVAKLLAGTKSFTCTAYSDKGKGDVTLTKSEAGAACSRLKRDGLSGKSRVVGRGHANPVASNHNRKGRAANRRLVISFTF